MNRILLIGNGFDLAHGLPTSYADFIKGYWDMRSYQLIRKSGMEINDGLCVYEVPDSDSRKRLNEVRPFITDNRFSYITQSCIEDIHQRFKKKYNSKFFEEINKAVETYNWVDIEAVYYHWLTKIFKQGECEYTDPNKLNDELKILEENLIIYLTLIQTKCVKPELVKDCIQKIIYEPLKAKDISNEGKKIFEDFLIKRLECLIGNDEQRVGCFLQRFGYSYIDWNKKIETYRESITSKYEFPLTNDTLDRRKHLQYINGGNDIVPDCFLWPDQILFLNFNYTSMADLYIPEGSEFKINHIHGELGNEKNPIIFGYGDELDDDYKEIAKLNDNDYLKNIKSIRYLETDNYRKLLSFIDSAPFQIYIMGHSCGNSDRTLLNTLFEHKNCVSIKPFYYEKPDGTDNYIEIVQNISRNFNDMRLMRDRVVNKTYCRPMVEVTAEQ